MDLILKIENKEAFEEALHEAPAELQQTFDNPDEVERFEAGKYFEYILPVITTTGPLIASVFGKYLSRGKASVTLGDRVFNNMTAAEINELLDHLKRLEEQDAPKPKP